MKLKFLQLDLPWPKEVPCEELREYLIAKLKTYGEPLRWSITAIEDSLEYDSLGALRVEAIVIIESI